MGETLEALLKLQSVELRLVTVRRQLSRQSAAVDAQQDRIKQLEGEFERLHDETLQRQKGAAALELDLKSREEDVAKLRASLNTAKTNKEYAAILTQLNTVKADNSRLEDQALRLMQQVDEARVKAEEVRKQLDQATQQLEEIQRTSAEEVGRLEEMIAKLQQERDSAAGIVPPPVLAVFERIASMREGEAMAKIEIEGKKPPYEYICGGCFMSIAAENANALQTRDELRFCDHCGRILYLAGEGAGGDSPPSGASEHASPQGAGDGREV